MLDWKALNNLISEADRVLITTHVRPDGDALGSELAMADLLVQKGRDVEIFNASPTPERYAFLDPDGTRINSLRDGEGAPASDPDLLVVLDTGTWSQLAGLADYVRQSKAAKVVIDHHQSQDELGALRLVDTTAPACAMLVHRAFSELGGTLTEESATALFTGIAMDTGWLHHSNTTSDALNTLSELVAAGAKPHVIYRDLFERNSYARIKLLGTMSGRIELRMNGRLAISDVYQQDIAQCAAHPMDTEDFINVPMSIDGVETSLLFIEQSGGGTKVSFRTRGKIDCSAVAEQFGGGGHRPAAGASIELPISQAKTSVIAAVEKAMTES